MTILLFAAMAYNLTGNRGHEFLGLFFLALFVIHNMLNRKWYATLPTGRYGAVRRIDTGITLALLAATLTVALTSAFISHDVFAFLGLGGTLQARKLHVWAAYWMFVLVSLHLGMHGRMIAAAAAKRGGALPLRILLGGIAAYGLYAFFEREFVPKLALLYTFDFWDYDRSAVFFFVDYGAIMCFLACLSYYVREIAAREGR